MRSYLVFSLICLWIFSGCQSQSDLAAEKEKLLETDKQFASLSAEAGAAEAFKHYLDSAAVQITASSDPINGRQNIFERMKPSEDKYTLLWEPHFADVSRSTDMGWTWGTYVMTVLSDSTQTHGYYLNVWTKKSDGSWRVVADIGNVKVK